MPKHAKNINGMDYTFLNWSDIYNECEVLCEKISKNENKFDCIIGLLRGGIIPARIISDFLLVNDIFCMDVKFYTGIGKKLDEPIIKFCDLDDKHNDILVVDDIYDSGSTMKTVKKFLKEEKKVSITTATLLCKKDSVQTPNYFSKYVKTKEWVIFPWEKNEFRTEMMKK